jgi:3D (Asp-Asp-Asp) domain-containing protein
MFSPRKGSRRKHLMRSSFCRFVGIACISTFFQLGVQAQNPAIPPSQLLEPSAPNSSDISKPGKPKPKSEGQKSDSQTPQIAEKASGKSYSALVFPVLRPRSVRDSEKTLAETPDKTSSSSASEISAEISARSWAIPPLKTRNRAVGAAGAESMIRAAIAEPKISLNNPSLRFRVNPSESKISGTRFTGPSMSLLGAPASFEATAYSLRGRTFSGAYVRRGVIAADPRVIPIGSVVQIVTPGYSGIYTVQDTGGKIKGKIVDVWVGSYREARIFGRRQVKLHVLRWGKPRRQR